jgi:uncharacterized membrane protein YbhN (UPF0104 family)
VSRFASRVRARLSGPGGWRTWLGLLLLLGLLSYALLMIFWRELPEMNLRELFGRISAADAALAFGVYSLDLALAIAGWVLIQGMLSGYWHPLDHFRIYTLTTMTRRLPGSFWYILGRVVLYERLGVARGVTAVAGGFEYAATILGGVLVALVTWPLVLGGQGVSPLWPLLLLLACAALLNPPMVRWAVRKLSPDHHTPAVRYRHLVAWVLLYALVWSVGGLLLFVVIGALRPLPLAQLPAIVGVWAASGLASMLIFNFVPLGLGVTEITLAALLSPYIAADEALFAALLMRALLTLSELGYGLVGALLSLPELLRPVAPSPPHSPHTNDE